MIALGQLGALTQVVLIDLTLAGDNAIVLGIIAGRLGAADRRRALAGGIVAAALIRIVLAISATRLLAVIGLTLAGGILLLWVAWKTAREIAGERQEAEGATDTDRMASRLGPVIWRIAFADLAMSLDNVLAVAGAAREHLWVLVVGLVLSVAMTGGAAVLTARLLRPRRFRGDAS